VNAAVPSAWRARRIHAAGVTVAAYEMGSDASDAPVVLLLHGLGHWTDAAWGRLVPRLDGALRYVAFDLPGFGASEKPDVRYDLAYFRRVVDDVVATLAPQRFAHVGHSLGGVIAAAWAGEHPERVTHLALIAPAGFARTPRFVLYAVLARLFGWAVPALKPSHRYNRRALERAVADPGSLDPAHVERTYELSQELAVRRAFGKVYSAALDTFGNRGALHRRFARYTGPAFCAWGRHDRYISVRGLRVVARVYPQATTLVLDHRGHLPTIEEPEALATALRAFLAS